MPEAPMDLETADLAAVIHRSLTLAEVLRGGLETLQRRLPLGRLSLIQTRASQATATLYTLDGGGSAPLMGPRVVALESSRLSRCLSFPNREVVPLKHVSEQDAAERKYLLLPDTHTAIYLPLMLDNKLKGVLVLALSSRRSLGSAHSAFLSYVADHLALAIENSDLHYMECRRSRQLTMVSETAKRAVLAESLGTFLRDVAQLIRSCFDYLNVQIWRTSTATGGLVLEASSSKVRHDSGRERNPSSMVKACLEGKATICDNNMAADAAEDVGFEHPASQAAVPILLRGRQLGVLFLESSRLDAFPEDDLSTMEGLASLLASTHENLRAFESAQQSNEYMQATLESAKDLAILSTDTQGKVITGSVGSESIFQLDQRRIHERDILSLFTDPHFRRELASYIGGSGPATLERRRLFQSVGNRNSFLDITVQRVYDTEQMLLGFLCIVQDVTENVLLEKRLESLSITDELTNLYNRRRFYAALAGEIERCRRFNRRISLCFFDLDGFKKFNDSHGHLEGDRALREAADILTSLIRSNVDTCYRYGGDEFVIIMPETSKQNAHLVSERVREQLNDHFQGRVTASIGIAESTASMTVEELVGKADRAMYRAKTEGGNRTVLAE